MAGFGGHGDFAIGAFIYSLFDGNQAGDGVGGDNAADARACFESDMGVLVSGRTAGQMGRSGWDNSYWCCRCMCSAEDVEYWNEKVNNEDGDDNG